MLLVYSSAACNVNLSFVLTLLLLVMDKILGSKYYYAKLLPKRFHLDSKITGFCPRILRLV